MKLKIEMYKSHNLATKIKEVAKERGIVIKIMLEEIGLGNNTMSALYHGKSIAFDSLARIADYLNCSVDCLLERTAFSETILNEKEKRLISAYRDQPNIQLAVDRLLGIDTTLHIKNNEVRVAAAGGDKANVPAGDPAQIGDVLQEIEEDLQN